MAMLEYFNMARWVYGDNIPKSGWRGVAAQIQEALRETDATAPEPMNTNETELMRLLLEASSLVQKLVKATGVQPDEPASSQTN